MSTLPYTVSVCVGGGATRSLLRAFGTLAEAIAYATHSVSRHFPGDLCEIHNERGELVWAAFGTLPERPHGLWSWERRSRWLRRGER